MEEIWNLNFFNDKDQSFIICNEEIIFLKKLIKSKEEKSAERERECSCEHIDLNNIYYCKFI